MLYGMRPRSGRKPTRAREVKLQNIVIFTGNIFSSLTFIYNKYIGTSDKNCQN